MPQVQSVLGPVDPGALGHCQIHEHIFLRPTPMTERNAALRFDDFDRSLAELRRYREAGGTSLVDAQPAAAGRDGGALERLSRESGVAVIASTGYHLLDFYPEDCWVHRLEEDALCALYQSELETGLLPWEADPSHRPEKALAVRAGLVKAAIPAEGPVGRYKTLLRAAARAAALVRVSYEELPFVLDVQEAMAPEAPQLHERCPGNLLAHTSIRSGDYQAASREPGLIRVEGWYDTPTVQHCHIENHICAARMEGGRITVTSSTQIPHIVRRVCGQALGIPWGKVRIIKPYIGGGFGNKQDALYEIDDIILSEYGTAVVGLEMLRSVNEESAEESRKEHIVQSAIGTLSFSELEAILHIFDELGDTEGILVASKIADRVGITRSVIVNALRKFESAGVIESRSSGMKGTYIKVLNEYVFTELEKIKKERM